MTITCSQIQLLRKRLNSGPKSQGRLVWEGRSKTSALWKTLHLPKIGLPEMGQSTGAGSPWQFRFFPEGWLLRFPFFTVPPTFSFPPGYSLPWEDPSFQYPGNFARPLEVAIEASNGASDYGNKFGEPVLAGEARGAWGIIGT